MVSVPWPTILNAPSVHTPHEKHTHYSPVLDGSNSKVNNPLPHHLPGEEALEEGLEDVAEEVAEEEALHHEAAVDLDTPKHPHLDSLSDLAVLNLIITKSIQLNLGKKCFLT